ncbi:MAG: hypothetical protein O9311_08070 [Cytophagales bacterium]|nr:hypothetical protein [Cytophagales bacterium]
MDKKVILILIAVFTISVLGCGQSTNREILIGKYCFNRFNQNSPKDSLFLFNDSTYIHKYWASDAKIFDVSGHWIYNSGGQEILFSGFKFFSDAGSRLPPGNWFSRVKISENNEVRLMYSEENNIYFIKVK